MSLSDILFLKALFGDSGGSAVDDGYCIRWDGNIEGRAKLIGMEELGATPCYKVSSKMFTAEELTGGLYRISVNDGHDEIDSSHILDLGGALAAENAFIVSGKAGVYNVGVPVTVPEDGTYFGLVDATVYIAELVKPASA